MDLKVNTVIQREKELPTFLGLTDSDWNKCWKEGNYSAVRLIWMTAIDWSSFDLSPPLLLPAQRLFQRCPWLMQSDHHSLSCHCSSFGRLEHICRISSREPVHLLINDPDQFFNLLPLKTPSYSKATWEDRYSQFLIAHLSFPAAVSTKYSGLIVTIEAIQWHWLS